VTPVEELEDMAMLRGVETSDRQQQITWCDQTQQTFFTDLSGYVSAVNDVNSLPIDLLTPAAKDLDKSWADHNNSKSSGMTWTFLCIFVSFFRILKLFIRTLSFIFINLSSIYTNNYALSRLWLLLSVCSWWKQSISITNDDDDDDDDDGDLW